MNLRGALMMLILSAACVPTALAHEIRPAYLQIREAGNGTYDVLWKVPSRGGLMLNIYVEWPADAKVIDEPVGKLANNAYVERYRVRCEGGLNGQSVSVFGSDAWQMVTLARVERVDGVTQTVRLTPGSQSFVVEATPSSFDVARTYSAIGFEHILFGIDHLLFVLGLLLLVDRAWTLFKTITAFTVAHSITLALATFAVVRVPAAPLNACIALSILFLGPEIVRKWRGQTSLTIRRPWVVAFAFGLLHGIGFASGLSVTGLPSADVPAALLFFNLGVEAGQIAFVFLMLAAARAIRTLELDRPRWVTRVPAYCVGSLGAFWVIQRVFMMFEL